MHGLVVVVVVVFAIISATTLFAEILK